MINGSFVMLVTMKVAVAGFSCLTLPRSIVSDSNLATSVAFLPGAGAGVAVAGAVVAGTTVFVGATVFASVCANNAVDATRAVRENNSFFILFYLISV